MDELKAIALMFDPNAYVGHASAAVSLGGYNNLYVNYYSGSEATATLHNSPGVYRRIYTGTEPLCLIAAIEEVVKTIKPSEHLTNDQHPARDVSLHGVI